MLGVQLAIWGGSTGRASGYFFASLAERVVLVRLAFRDPVRHGRPLFVVGEVLDHEGGFIL